MGEEQLIAQADPQRTRQLILCLDGLRYSCAIVAMCHRRAITKLRTFETHPDVGPSTSDAIEVISDVWSIVDAAQRVRQLLNQLPLIKQHTPELVVFMRATAAVEALRDYIQHINQELSKLATTGPPLWGTVAWACEQNPLTCMMLIPTSSRLDHSSHTIAFDTQEWRYVTGLELRAGDIALDFDDVAARTRALDDFLCDWTKRIRFSDGGRFEYRPTATPMLAMGIKMPSAELAPLTATSNQ